MPLQNRSLLRIRNLKIDEVGTIFSVATQLQAHFLRRGTFLPYQIEPKTVGLLFFEASTRTRTSFEISALRLGLRPFTLNFQYGSSLEKGETARDSVANIAAMEPDLLIIRHNDFSEFETLLQKLKIPVINAGSGVDEHPTQALLDAYTISKEKGPLAGKKVFIFGDILHSRVARSNYELLKMLDAEVGIFGPASLLPNKNDMPDARRMLSMSEGLKWCDVAMALRVQLERNSQLKEFDRESYHREYGLHSQNIKELNREAIILHPGPVNYGVELAQEISQDPRSRILSQVQAGVYIRAALQCLLLGLPLENRP